MSLQAIKKAELQKVIVDSTVQEKAIAHPTDSRLLDVARDQLAELAKKLGLAPKQTFEREAVLLRLQAMLDKALRIHAQTATKANASGRGKLYALHAPEAECISKGKARKPYEFGVKVSLAVTHAKGLIVGARSFPGNPYDGQAR